MNAENKSGAQQALEEMLHLLHEKAPDTIGDRLHLRAGDCDPQAGEYTMYAQAEPWMCNPYGTVHGGIISAMMAKSKLHISAITRVFETALGTS